MTQSTQSSLSKSPSQMTEGAGFAIQAVGAGFAVELLTKQSSFLPNLPLPPSIVRYAAAKLSIKPILPTTNTLSSNQAIC